MTEIENTPTAAEQLTGSGLTCPNPKKCITKIVSDYEQVFNNI